MTPFERDQLLGYIAAVALVMLVSGALAVIGLYLVDRVDEWLSEMP